MNGFPPVGEMKFSVKPFSKGLRSLEAAPQVAIRRWRNTPFETRCPSRVSTKLEQKERPTKWLVFSESLRILRDALLFWFWLIPVIDRNQKGVFRALRSATQGAALRTRGLLKKAGENFI